MPTVSVPLSFSGSFWSQDYRTGLEVLYGKLDQGVEENEQILAFLHHRASTSKDYALTTINRVPAVTKKPLGFDKDEGAGLLFTFRGLEAQAKAQGQVHLNFARSLTDLVELPFAKWTDEHQARVTDSRRVILDGWIGAWEKQREDVRKLKVLRGEKARSAEVAEAEARFSAPGGHVDLGSPSKTASPSFSPVHGGHRRTLTISERISNNIKKQFGETAPPVPEKDVESSTTASPTSSSSTDQPTDTEKPAPSTPTGKPSIAIDTSFSAAKKEATPPPVLLAGLALPTWKATELIDAAHANLATRTIHLPLLGEYTDCFAGFELISFLEKHVEGFGGSREMAEQAARELVEDLGVVRRVVAVGKGSWGREEDYYQLTGKKLRPEDTAAGAAPPNSPLSSAPSTASSLLARSGSILASRFGNSAGSTSSVALHVRARQEADHIEGVYKTAVRKLDRTRMRMEETIQDGLVLLQRWEADRLQAIKTVLAEYQRLVASLPEALKPSFDTSELLLDAYSPASDLDALIQRYRTGGFRPQVDVYEPFADAKTDVVFGGDVYRWAEGVGWKLPGEKEQEKEEGELLHPVVRALLARLRSGYPELPNDDERRKTWIYEVPLQATHVLRDALVSLPHGAAHIPEELLKRDLPIIAATLKLWLLELSVPLGPDYDDVKTVYPSIGAGTDKETSDQKVEELKGLLTRIPKIRLILLDGVIGHLRTLVNETSSAEPDDVYISKVGQTLSRALVRPDHDTSLSIEDRTPAVFVADLISYYDAVFPSVISARRAEVDKPRPARRLTRPIDRRPSRSMMSEEERVLAQAQFISGGIRSPGLSRVAPSPGRPYVPPNENSARQETDEQIRDRVETSKRESLNRLRVQKEKDDELPPGFTVSPPTPIGLSSGKPFEKDVPPPPRAGEDQAFIPPKEDSAYATPTAPSPVSEDKPFSPPVDSDDKPPTFTQPKDDDDSDSPRWDKPFSPPSEDASLDKPFSPPSEDAGSSRPISPAADDSVASRRAALERKAGPASLGGPRGPRVGGPRGARLATPSGSPAGSHSGRSRADSFTRSAQPINLEDE